MCSPRVSAARGNRCRRARRCRRKSCRRAIRSSATSPAATSAPHMPSPSAVGADEHVQVIVAAFEERELIDRTAGTPQRARRRAVERHAVEHRRRTVRLRRRNASRSSRRKPTAATHRTRVPGRQHRRRLAVEIRRREIADRHRVQGESVVRSDRLARRDRCVSADDDALKFVGGRACVPLAHAPETLRTDRRVIGRRYSGV